MLRNLVLVAESPGQTGHGRGLEGEASGASYCIALQLLFCTFPHLVHNQATVQCTMRTLESRMEPYAKKNRKVYRGTEAFEASSNKIARYHIQICVYDTEAYSA